VERVGFSSIAGLLNYSNCSRLRSTPLSNMCNQLLKQGLRAESRSEGFKKSSECIYLWSFCF